MALFSPTPGPLQLQCVTSGFRAAALDPDMLSESPVTARALLHFYLQLSVHAESAGLLFAPGLQFCSCLAVGSVLQQARKAAGPHLCRGLMAPG